MALLLGLSYGSARAGVDELEATVDSVAEAVEDWSVGSDPGFITTELYEAVAEALAEAEALLAAGTDDETAETARAALLAAVEAAESNRVALEDGMYYIVNTYSYTGTDADYNVVSIERALYAYDNYSYLCIKTLDEEDTHYIWEITDNGDGSYAVENYAAGTFISIWSSDYYYVYTYAYEYVRPTFVDNGDGSWGIFSADDEGSYGVYPYSDVSEWVVSWPSTQQKGSRGTWYLRNVSDEVLDSLVHLELDPELEAAMDSASALLSSLSDYGQLTDGAQAAADALEAEVAYINENWSSTGYDDLATLRELIAELNTQLGDPQAYYDALDEASDLAAAVVVGDGVGYVSQEALDEFLAAVEAAGETANLDAATGESILAAVSAINAAIETLKAAIGMPEAGKWYYLVSAAASGDTRGMGIYTPCGQIYDGAQYSVLCVGGNDGDELSTESKGDARFMWTPIDAGDGLLYLGNRQMGVGINLTGGGYVYYAGYTEGSVSAALRLEYVKEGAFNIGADVNDTYYCFYAMPEWYGSLYSYPYSGDTYARLLWTIEEVDEEDMEVLTVKALQNSVRVQTLAFNVGELAGSSVMDLNAEWNVQTFGVKDIIADEDAGTTDVELVYKTEFAAGEPMILMIGDPESYTSIYSREGSDTINMMIPLPSEWVYETTVDGNGLRGTLVPTTISESGLGYLAESVLKVTGGDDVEIEALEGWLDAALLTEDTDDETEADYILTCSDGLISGIRAVGKRAAESEAVYDLEGRLVSADGTEGLAKGIYIVGGRKVLLR